MDRLHATLVRHNFVTEALANGLSAL